MDDRWMGGWMDGYRDRYPTGAVSLENPDQYRVQNQ